MGDHNPETMLGQDDNQPPSVLSDGGIDFEYQAIGANPEVTLQPGETLIVYHPHSHYPTRIIPTEELHNPRERTARCDIESPKASYAPFPTRVDFEQAEIFVNGNFSDKQIDAQLKFERQNGMGLEVKSARGMHKILARGVEENLPGDSMVCSVHSAIGISCFS